MLVHLNLDRSFLYDLALPPLEAEWSRNGPLGSRQNLLSHSSIKHYGRSLFCYDANASYPSARHHK